MLIIQSLLASKQPLYLRHHSPGRLRLAGEFFSQQRSELLTALEKHHAITEVAQNPATCSLLLLFDQGAEQEVFRSVIDALPQQEQDFRTTPAGPKVLQHVGRLMSNLDKVVLRSSYHWFDAQALVPTFLCLYGIRRLLKGQSRFPTWVTVMWWSYATLWNLSQQEAKRP